MTNAHLCSPADRGSADQCRLCGRRHAGRTRPQPAQDGGRRVGEAARGGRPDGSGREPDHRGRPSVTHSRLIVYRNIV